jgi:hypothetical protein
MRIWLGILQVVEWVVVVTMRGMVRAETAERMERVERGLVRRWSRSAGGSVSDLEAIRAGRKTKIKSVHLVSLPLEISQSVFLLRK